MLRGPNTWSYIIPGLSVRVFLVEMNIWISRLSKSDCIHNMDVPHAINWKLNRTKKLSKREFFLSELMSWETNLFQPSDSIETFHPDSFFKILIFNFNEIQLVILSFIDFDFGGISKAYCQVQDHLDFFLCYLLEVLYFGT